MYVAFRQFLEISPDFFLKFPKHDSTRKIRRVLRFRIHCSRLVFYFLGLQTVYKTLERRAVNFC